MTATPYGFRILGNCSGERRLIDHALAFTAYAHCDVQAKVDLESYLSAFTFGLDFREYMGRLSTTRGFSGLCFAPDVKFDIDREGDLQAAQDGAGRLVTAIVERYKIADDALLLFFSGSKGFHIGLPTFWAPAPSADFHRIARQFCETLAQTVGVEIDTGIYDKVRAFRAPNSRHPKTGLHKRRLTLRELLHLGIDEILAMAKAPVPFEIPTISPDDGDVALAADDWNAATAEIGRQAEVRMVRRRGETGPTLNRTTIELIRDGAAVSVGDRHRLLFSAAANLGEYGCPPALAHALLTESGLDSGLTPSEVKRQIDCGLSHKDGEK
jgi:hypothetical protein